MEVGGSMVVTGSRGSHRIIPPYSIIPPTDRCEDVLPLPVVCPEQELKAREKCCHTRGHLPMCNMINVEREIWGGREGGGQRGWGKGKLYLDQGRVLTCQNRTSLGMKYGTLTLPPHVLQGTVSACFGRRHDNDLSEGTLRRCKTRQDKTG